MAKKIQPPSPPSNAVRKRFPYPPTPRSPPRLHLAYPTNNPRRLRQLRHSRRANSVSPRRHTRMRDISASSLYHAGPSSTMTKIPTTPPRFCHGQDTVEKAASPQLRALHSPSPLHCPQEMDRSCVRARPRELHLHSPTITLQRGKQQLQQQLATRCPRFTISLLRPSRPANHRCMLSPETSFLPSPPPPALDPTPARATPRATQPSQATAPSPIPHRAHPAPRPTAPRRPTTTRTTSKAPTTVAETTHSPSTTSTAETRLRSLTLIFVSTAASPRLPGLRLPSRPSRSTCLASARRARTTTGCSCPHRLNSDRCSSVDSYNQSRTARRQHRSNKLPTWAPAVSRAVLVSSTYLLPTTLPFRSLCDRPQVDVPVLRRIRERHQLLVRWRPVCAAKLRYRRRLSRVQPHPHRLLMLQVLHPQPTQLQGRCQRCEGRARSIRVVVLHLLTRLRRLVCSPAPCHPSIREARAQQHLRRGQPLRLVRRRLHLPAC